MRVLLPAGDPLEHEVRYVRVLADHDEHRRRAELARMRVFPPELVDLDVMVVERL